MQVINHNEIGTSVYCKFINKQKLNHKYFKDNKCIFELTIIDDNDNKSKIIIEGIATSNNIEITTENFYDSFNFHGTKFMFHNFIDKNNKNICSIKLDEHESRQCNYKIYDIVCILLYDIDK